MLSDRIKKFGVQAKNTDRSGETQISDPLPTEQAEHSARKEDLTDTAKAALSAAFEKASYTAAGPTVTTYVEQKLHEADQKAATRVQPDKTQIEPPAESAKDDKKEGSGEVPLLLRYSAALQNMREAAKNESKTTPSESKLEDNGQDEEITEDLASALEDKKEEKSAEHTVITETSATLADGTEKKVRTYSFGSLETTPVRSEIVEESISKDKEPHAKPQNAILSKSCLYAPVLVTIIEGLMLIVSRLSLSSLQARDNLYLSMVVIQLMIFLIPGIFYCKLRHGGDISSLRLKGTNPDKLYIAVLAAFLMLFVMSAFKILYLRIGIYESRFALYAPYLNTASFSSVAEVLYMSIAFVLIPSVSEEFIFRSVVFGEYMSDGFGYICAAVISSILYAMLHFSLVRFPMYFAIGLILAVTSIIADSSLISMITAAIFGLLDIFTESYITSLMRSDYKILLVFVVITLMLLFLTLFLAETERLIYGKGTSGDPSPKKRQRKESLPVLLGAAISSPSFIICVAIFVAGTIISRF